MAPAADEDDVDTALRPAVPPLPTPVRPVPGQADVAQQFVARMRAAAPDFAAAAGAETAVVREVVPPARHRRSRCRVVLRFAAGEQLDLTFLGPVIRSAASPGRAFDLQIQTWLANGSDRDGSWVVPDGDSPDGTAVDVTAWSAGTHTDG